MSRNDYISDVDAIEAAFTIRQYCEEHLIEHELDGCPLCPLCDLCVQEFKGMPVYWGDEE